MRLGKKGRKGASKEESLRPNGCQERRSTLPLLVAWSFTISRRHLVVYRHHVLEPSLSGEKAILRLRQLVARSKASSNSKLEKIEEANLELHRDEMYKRDAIELTNILRWGSYRSFKNLFYIHSILKYSSFSSLISFTCT